jgi:hypothetical protein
MIEYIRRFFGLEKRKRFDGSRPVGWTSLAGLLEDLEAVADKHEEIFDTEVRGRMWEYLEARFIQHKKATPLPTDFGMFTPEGNEQIRIAFAQNTENLDTIIKIFYLDTEKKRKVTFTNPKLISAGGNHLDDFFGAP